MLRVQRCDRLKPEPDDELKPEAGDAVESSTALLEMSFRQSCMHERGRPPFRGRKTKEDGKGGTYCQISVGHPWTCPRRDRCGSFPPCVRLHRLIPFCYFVFFLFHFVVSFLILFFYFFCSSIFTLRFSFLSFLLFYILSFYYLFIMFIYLFTLFISFLVYFMFPPFVLQKIANSLSSNRFILGSDPGFSYARSCCVSPLLFRLYFRPGKKVDHEFEEQDINLVNQANAK